MNIRERLKEFIAFKGLTMNAFEVQCELSTRFVSKADSSIKSDIIEKIVLKFPELNADWLITGRGYMLYNNKEKTKESTINELMEENLRLMRKQMEYMQQELEELKKASARTA